MTCTCDWGCIRYILQHTASQYYSMQLTATHCVSLQFCCNTQLTATASPPAPVTGAALATHCNTLHHTTTRCNSLQLTATCCNTQLIATVSRPAPVIGTASATRCNTLYHNTTQCMSLQLTVNHCNLLQITATCYNTQSIVTVSQPAPVTGAASATHCNTLQHNIINETYCTSLQLAATHS